MIGKVVSDKMQKTAVVAISRVVKHPFYGKNIRRVKKYKAGNELGAKMGDKVRIEPSRPLSKEKHFKVVEVIEHGSAA
jgi:small subunit ribosomal protein S17